ncbi:hypothetical protein [Sphingobacterium siyangense]|jgi:hypothetical protein|uniref:hypothetical protein n=1 Tax=Sphingobacterium siyangense TaxID=459529 RepID=UPI003C755B89
MGVKYNTKKTCHCREKENIGKLFYKIQFPYDIYKENLGGLAFIAEFRVLMSGEPLGLYIPATANIASFEERSFTERMKEKVLPENRIKYAPYIPNTRD